MFTVLKVQLKLLLEKAMAAFTQPKFGEVQPINEKVKAVMEAPYKIEPPLETPVKKKAPAKKTAAKKAPTKKAATKKTPKTK